LKDPNRFYVYTYLDPRKPGQYSYGDYCFLYEPFYVGKGCRDRDVYHIHLAKIDSKNESNIMKSKVLKIIKECDMSPLIFRIRSNMSENNAFSLENEIIKLVGLKGIDSQGILVNRNYGGIGGRGDVVVSAKTKALHSFRNTLEGMIDLHGEEKGTRVHEERRKCKSERGKQAFAEGKGGLAKFFASGGNPHTPEIRAKVAEKLKGRKRSPEECEHIKQGSNKGRKNYMTKPYVITAPLGEEFVYLDGLYQFCSEQTLNVSSLQKLLGKRTRNATYKGWKVRYATPEDVEKFKKGEAQ